eukprot:7098880-Prymnesium_polylepis.1
MSKSDARAGGPHASPRAPPPPWAQQGGSGRADCTRRWQCRAQRTRAPPRSRMACASEATTLAAAR